LDRKGRKKGRKNPYLIVRLSESTGKKRDLNPATDGEGKKEEKKREERIFITAPSWEKGEKMGPQYFLLVFSVSRNERGKRRPYAVRQ